MKVIYIIIDACLSFIKYCFPICNIDKIKLIFKELKLDKKKADDIIKMLTITEEKLYNILHEEISKLEFKRDYDILYNKIFSELNNFNLTSEDKMFIKRELYILYYCLSNDMGKFIFCIKHRFIKIILKITSSFIKRYIIYFYDLIRIINKIKQESDILSLILIKNGVINIIIYNLLPLILYNLQHKTYDKIIINMISIDKKNKNTKKNINELNHGLLKKINLYLKKETENQELLSNIYAGAKKYNMENIELMINSLQDIKNNNTLYDTEKVNEFINFLEDKHVQELLEHGKIEPPYKFKDIINTINTEKLNSDGYISLNIFNELMDTDIGRKLLKIFSGKSPKEISDTIFGAEQYLNNSLDLENNSFGFKKSDIVVFTVLECLDAIRASYNNKNCCDSNRSLIVNINTPVENVKVNDADINLQN
ncbi:hypothetical protein [Alphaentomopoxvirus acuprea]|uniref:Uncharacterized protein n=1 Tax=Alphaentomopoxvirus acuprea TaxID=62099 RepID=W6JKY7_9POXV|nr:hypothetical protein BA82_gp095 [Anomala cuprea entomopoxvirus]BAO49455.1 hypothetical protein [Anomala cuprea entomopoxvirus]